MAKRGPVELATWRMLRGLKPVPGHEALEASALVLARTLDNGAGLATAAVARELRTTVEVLTREEETSGQTAADRFLAAMSAPLVNSPN